VDLRTRLTCRKAAGGRAQALGIRPSTGRSIRMLDLVMLAIAAGFFALTIGYAYACDRL
jgi:hypothetical protein